MGSTADTFLLMNKSIGFRSSWVRWAAVLLWMGLIFGLSAISGLKSGLVEGLDLVLRKIAHATEFGILGALTLRALTSRNEKVNWRALAVAGLIAAAYAVTDEYHQSYVRDRVASARDVGIDWLGVVIGLGLYRQYRLRQSKNSRA